MSDLSETLSAHVEEDEMDHDTVDGYDIPQDPMDMLQCESCQ